MSRAPSNPCRLFDSAPALIALGLILATLALWISIVTTLAGAT